MSGYRVTGYKVEYSEEQAILGIEVSKNWVMPENTPVGRLAERYRSHTRDPSLMLYCFEREKMVGFTVNRLVESSTNGLKRGKMGFPVVLQGHGESVGLLYEKSVEAFRDLGVGVIELTVGLRGGSIEWAEKRGFTKIDEVGVLYVLDVGSWAGTEVHKVDDFDPDMDLELVVEYFSSQFNLPADDVRAFTLRLLQDEDTLGYYVVRGVDGLKASGVLGVNPNVPRLGLMSAAHDEGVEYLRSLVGAMVSEAKAHGVEQVYMYFTHLSPGHPLMDKFTSLGFNCLGHNTRFERRL